VLRNVKNPSGTISKKAVNRIQIRELPKLTNVFVGGLISKHRCDALHKQWSEAIMPEFGNPFAGLKEGRKLTDAELVRAIRFMISAEYEAIQLYMQLAESIDNPLAKDVLIDIADEERVHAGEFLRLLYELEPAEKDFYKKGADEVEEELAKAAKPKPTQSRAKKQ
jgi:hypothetical protein